MMPLGAGDSVFFRGVASGRLLKPQGVAPQPHAYGQHRLALVSYKVGEQEIVRRMASEKSF